MVKDHLNGKSCCALMMTIICVLICVTPFLMLIGYLGVFAFNNPNSEGWYGVVGG